MIDINTESLVSFAEVPAWLPRRRGNRRVHVSTIHRWARRGCRGVRLEFIQVGGTMCTSTEAIQRFCDRLTNQAPTAHEQHATPPTPRPAGLAEALDRCGL